MPPFPKKRSICSYLLGGGVTVIATFDSGGIISNCLDWQLLTFSCRASVSVK